MQLKHYGSIHKMYLLEKEEKIMVEPGSIRKEAPSFNGFPAYVISGLYQIFSTFDKTNILCCLRSHQNWMSLSFSMEIVCRTRDLQSDSKIVLKFIGRQKLYPVAFPGIFRLLLYLAVYNKSFRWQTALRGHCCQLDCFVVNCHHKSLEIPGKTLNFYQQRIASI